MKQLILVSLTFLIVELVGLLAGLRAYALLSNNQIQPAFSNPNDPFNSLYLFVMLIISTSLILLTIKLRKRILVYIEYFSVFVLLSLFFSFFFPTSASLILSAILILLNTKIKNPLFKNFLSVLSVYSAASILGISLGVLPSLIFGTLLSVYDFISVFITKHMVFLARELITRPSFFMLTFPAKRNRKVSMGKHKVKLNFHSIGTGDFLVPLTFSISLLPSYGVFSSLTSLIFSSCMLFFLLYFQSTRKKPTVYPALPFIFSGSLLGFILSLIIFYLQSI